MKFEELPHELQLIAAQTLSNRLSELGVGMNERIEPVKTLAREVKEAFIELYLPSESELARNGNDLKEE